MIQVIQTKHPQQTLRDEIARRGVGEVFAITYDFHQTFMPEAQTIQLIALVGVVAYSSVQDQDSNTFGFTIFPHTEQRVTDIAQLEPSLHAIQRYTANNCFPWFDLKNPLHLQPVKIPKPWGQEIWYTGIEARGESQIGVDGSFIPLSWLLSLSGESLGAPEQSLILLKILDPLPFPVFGDLYFEMHQQKREVYVVTNIDPVAWPDGVGGIRFGFDQSRRKMAASDDDFKQQYLHAVTEYRAIREEIDQLLDQCRSAADIDLLAPVDAVTTKAWLSQLPAELLDSEVSLREAMESFIHVQPLQLGDVIKVPTLTPHSLLHGVRTVEFQTPVYERKILSFAQKVLTQNHWDTVPAMAEVSLEAPDLPDLPVIYQNVGVTIESVVMFEDFAVERLSLAAGAQYAYPRDSYLIAMVVTGVMFVDDVSLCAEESVLCATHTDNVVFANNTEQGSVILLARPATAVV